MADKLDLEPLDLEPVEQENALDLEPLDLEPVDTEDKSLGQSLKETGKGLLLGAEQGASLGFADEIQAAIQNYQTRRELKRMGLEPSQLNEKAMAEKAKQEKQSLAEARQEFAKAQEAAPIAYGTGLIGGGISTIAATAPLVGAGLKGATIAGGIEGGLAGYGASEAETLKEALPEIGMGLGIGAVLPGAAQAAKPIGQLAVAPLKAAAKGTRQIVSNVLESEALRDVKKGFEYGAKKGKSLFSEAPAEEASAALEKQLGEGLGVVSKAKKGALEVTQKAEQEVIEKTKAAQEQIKKQLADSEALEAANNKLLQEEKIAFEQGKKSKVSQLNKEVDKNARQLAENYSNLYNSLGSSRRTITQHLEEQGAIVDTLPFEEQIRKMFGDITTDEMSGRTVFSNMRNINASDTTKIGNILEDIRKFQGEIPYSKVEELRDVLQKYAYGKGGVTEESKRALKSLYDAMNKSIDSSLAAQGFQDSAKRLGEINQGFRTLYKASDIGFEKVSPDDLISGTGYQKFAREAGVEEYTPRFGEQKERMFSSIEEVLQSPAIGEEQKQALRQAVERARTTSKELAGTEAQQFVSRPIEAAPKPVLDKEAITQQVMGSPEVQAASKAMQQVQDVEQVFGDVLTRGTKEARIPSKALTTAEVAGTDRYAAKIREIDTIKRAVRELDPANADKIIAQLDEAVEEAGFISRTNRGAPIGDIKSQVTGGPRAFLVKSASAVGVGKKLLREEISKASPEQLKEIARQVRTGLGKAVGTAGKVGDTTREVFANMLEKAADNQDKIARNATLYMLLQDPKYRELTESNVEE